jgi:ribosomal protein S21
MSKAVKIKVEVKKNISSALKNWKLKSRDILKELKDRKEYTKPSQKRRNEKNKAIYINNKKYATD